MIFQANHTLLQFYFKVKNKNMIFIVTINHLTTLLIRTTIL